LVDVVRFELTKPCGNRVTAGSDTPTSTAHPKILNTLSATFQSMSAQCVY